MQTTRIVRPPESTSRLAHWIASSSGWRSGKLARQTSPSFSRLVLAASADSVTIDSRRGLDSRLSPTQAESKKPERSAVSAVSSRAIGETPNRTARFGKLIPKRTGFVTDATMLPPYPWVEIRGPARCVSTYGHAGAARAQPQRDQAGRQRQQC